MRNCLKQALLVALLTCSCSTTPTAAVESPVAAYVYMNANGDRAVLNLTTNSITVAHREIRLQSCSNTAIRCVHGDGVHIEVPVTCPNGFVPYAFGSQSKGVKFSSLDGVSEGAYFENRGNTRFSYSYFPTRGILKLVFDDLAPGGASELEALRSTAFLLGEGDGPWACR